MSNSVSKKGYEYRHIYYVNKMVFVSNRTFDSTPQANIHFHNGYEIILITRGNYKIYAPNKLYEGSGPCVAAFRLGSYHGCIFSDCETVSANRIVINYTQGFVDSIPSYMLNAKELFEHDVSVVPLDENSFERLFFLFDELYRHCNSSKNDENTSPETYGYMTVVLNSVAEVLRSSDAIQASVYKNDDNYVYDVIRELLSRADGDKPISVASLSEQFFVSRTKLSDDFQRVAGINIKKMIDELRIERIKRMLSAGISNKEIVEQLGFSSESYFIQFFKKHMNVSPGDYRKKQ